MGSVLLQKEIRVSIENLQGLIESNWTTFFPRVTHLTFIRQLHGTELNPGSSALVPYPRFTRLGLMGIVLKVFL